MEKRFAQFATFISAFLSIVTVILLFFTFRQTRSSHNLTISTFEETKKNSIDNTFFNLIKTYQTIIERLNNRITISLQLEFVKLNEDNNNRFGNDRRDKDFFELMYRMLDLEYRPKDEIRDINKVSGFFGKHNWLMGHYFQSVIYIITWVHQNSELMEKQKKFYVGFLQTQLTADELRLLFYFIVSKNNNDKIELVQIFNHYNFFDSIKLELIYQDNDVDWKEFEKNNK